MKTPEGWFADRDIGKNMYFDTLYMKGDPEEGIDKAAPVTVVHRRDGSGYWLSPIYAVQDWAEVGPYKTLKAAVEVADIYILLNEEPKWGTRDSH